MMGGFECDCVQGWMDDDCRTAVDSCRNETCLNGGWCEDTKCKCPHGVSGYNCQIDNKCASNACKNGATCRSTPTGYRCQCTDGFAGRLCSDDVDECDRFDLRDVCPKKPVCVNTFASVARIGVDAPSVTVAAFWIFTFVNVCLTVSTCTSLAATAIRSHGVDTHWLIRACVT